jgi:hypothetical protein
MAPNDPRFIDLDVEWIAKGEVQQKSVRAWNPSAGTSCGGAFAVLVIGNEVAVALTQLSPTTEPVDDLYWQTLGFRPPLGEYLISAGCADPFVILTTPEDRSRYFGKRIQ